MGVVGQDVGDAFLTHGLHGNAIGKAVSLVWAGLVKGEPGKKRLVRLWMNCNRQIGMEIADKVNRFLPEQATGLGESVQNLGQDFFSVTRWHPARVRLAVTAAWCHWSLRWVMAIQ
jgi:hypothetical protein